MQRKIMQEMNKLLKPNLSVLRFQHKGQWYRRIVGNQIYQTLNFQGGMDGIRFTVNIDILPLFCNNIFNSSMRIGNFIDGRDIWWYYDKGIDEALQVVKEKVIPVFDEITSYEKLYETICEFIKNKPTTITNYKNGLYFELRPLNIFWLCVKLNKINECHICLENSLNEISTSALSEVQRYKNLLENNFNELLQIADQMEKNNLKVLGKHMIIH